MAVLQQIFVLFLIILVGIVTRKSGIVKEDFKLDLSRFLIYIAMPTFIVNAIGISFQDRAIDEVMGMSNKLVLLSLLMYGLAIILSFAVARVMKLDIDERNVMQYAIVFANVGFMGYPVIDVIYGTEGVFYAALYNLPFNIFIWTVGVFLISRGKEKAQSGGMIKKLINPGIIAIFFGFILFIFKIKLPYTLTQTIGLIGNLTTPLAMLLIGFTLSEVNLKEIIRDGRCFIIVAIRLVIFPALFYCVLSVLGFEGYLLTIPVIISAMPVAINGAIFAMNYDSDYVFATKLVFLSSVFCLITIPALIYVLS